MLRKGGRLCERALLSPGSELAPAPEEQPGGVVLLGHQQARERERLGSVVGALSLCQHGRPSISRARLQAQPWWQEVVMVSHRA